MNLRPTAHTLATLAAALLLATGAQAAPTDAELAAAVRARVLQETLFQDPAVELRVAAQGGVVQLSGWVRYADDDLRARQLAAQVPGVQSVSSQFRSWSSSAR
ncbi:BON domain-containing protein [Ideonella livida]|uniref:BON domain-containing protein n=1 Tax=Ideonella livida TaxID=2707176 RepID=A0A7C9PFX3_9BURK|nr:BON domain-containing protein [Ideonella livida]NDY90390.1 BON domain-containing protein [Ideonella livida]